MKYTIYWLEYHICDNEGDEQAWLDSLPPNTKSCGDVFDEGVFEFECKDIFEADSIEEAKKEASEYECGQEGIFNVFDEAGKKVFDEGDLEY